MANTPPAASTGIIAQTSQAVNDDRHKVAMNVQLQILREMQQLNELNHKIHGQPPLKSKELWNFLLSVFGLLAATSFGVFAILAWKAADRANEMADSAASLASSANALASEANGIASSGNRVAATARGDAAIANIMAIWARCEATPTGTATPAITGDPCHEVMLAMSDSYAFFEIADRYFSLAPHEEPTRSSLSSQSSATMSTAISSATSSAPNDSNSTGSRASRPAPSGLIAGAVIGALAGCALLFGIAYLPYQTYRAKLRRAQELASLKDQKVEGKTA